MNKTIDTPLNAALGIVGLWAEDPLLLYKDVDQSRQILNDLLKNTFKQTNKTGQLVFGQFKLDQVWEQIEHHTSKVNAKIMQRISSMINDEDFIAQLLGQQQEGEIDRESSYAFVKEEEKQGIDAQYGSEQESIEDAQDSEQPDDKSDESQLDDLMQGMEEDELVNDELKIPSDLEGDDEEESEEEGLFPPDNEGSFPLDDEYGQEEQQKKKGKLMDSSEDEEGALEKIFQQANANQEMDIVENILTKNKMEGYINQEMVKKIEQIEDEMMNPKEWQLTGEARASDRPKDSLLQVHLDFNSATKLPPTITRETTNAIDALIKQRVLDELFDDPVLKQGAGKRRKLDEREIDFNKSKTGLGEIYADDLNQKLLRSNPEAFLESELSGPDAPLKREIEELSKDLFQNLDTLSNFHFTPKVARIENQISTQNVPSLLLEDALPIQVSKGQTKTAREVFQLKHGALRQKTELSKEERQAERASKKRKIKTSAHNRAIHKKEVLRQQGLQLAERFIVKETKRHMEKISKKKGKKDSEDSNTGRRTNSSTKVFKNLQKIVQEDYKRKDDKKQAKASGQYVPKRTFGESIGSTKKYML